MLGWLVLMLAVAAAAAAAAGGDQYAQQASGPHRFNVPQHAEELQVGCAEGELHHKHHGPVLQVLKRLKRQAELRRQRRDYIQWFGSSTTFQQSQPNYIQSYQIQSPVPYFVPIWGNPRRIPVFFPTKPILLNPGYPVRNPPGTVPSTEAPPGTGNGDTDVPFSIGTRINVNKDGEPIWGIVEPDSPGNNLGGGGAARPPATTELPTRPPTSSGIRPTRPPTPPLLHRPSVSDEPNQGAQQPSGVSDRDNPNIAQQFRPPVNQFRPQTTTTVRPPAVVTQPQGRDEPNRCVWAIISCCNPTNNQISYNCFERLGCPGAFWDSNPCSREVTAAAFNAAAKFYEQR